MKELENCCFCFPLRTGSLIIGYLCLVYGISLTIISILSISLGLTVLYQVGDGDHGMASMIIGISSIMLILSLVFLSFAIALLVGLHKEKDGHVKAFLIFAIIFLIINMILFFFNIAIKSTDTLAIVGNFVWIALYIYFLLVLRSHYMKMIEQKRVNV